MTREQFRSVRVGQVVRCTDRGNNVAGAGWKHNKEFIITSIDTSCTIAFDQGLGVYYSYLELGRLEKRNKIKLKLER
jgi:hypothetical protein